MYAGDLNGRLVGRAKARRRLALVGGRLRTGGDYLRELGRQVGCPTTGTCRMGCGPAGVRNLQDDLPGVAGCGIKRRSTKLTFDVH